MSCSILLYWFQFTLFEDYVSSFVFYVDYDVPDFHFQSLPDLFDECYSIVWLNFATS